MRYFIAYSFNDVNGSGYGNCVFQPNHPIASGDDIAAISQQIASRNGFRSVVVIGLTPLPSVGSDEYPA